MITLNENEACIGRGGCTRPHEGGCAVAFKEVLPDLTIRIIWLIGDISTHCEDLNLFGHEVFCINAVPDEEIAS